MYLLLDCDVPWVPDPQRDMPHRRHEIRDLCREELDRRGLPWRLVDGSWAERLAAAREWCRRWWAEPGADCAIRERQRPLGLVRHPPVSPTPVHGFGHGHGDIVRQLAEHGRHQAVTAARQVVARMGRADEIGEVHLHRLRQFHQRHRAAMAAVDDVGHRPASNPDRRANWTCVRPRSRMRL